MKLINQYIPQNKIEIIFKELENFLKNEISGYKTLLPYVEKFRKLLNEEDENLFFTELESIGKDCSKNNVLYIETLSIIEFLRKSFTEIMPDSTPFSTIKKFETFFNKLESSFSKGFLIEQTKKDYKDFEEFKQYIQNKNLEGEFYYYFSTHIDYLLTCLKSLFNYDYCIVAIIETCDFGEWLKERKKDLLKEEPEIIEKMEQIHNNFHKLLTLLQNAYHKQQYKKVIFLFEELKNNALWIGNKISILNSILVLKKLRKDPLTGLLTRHNLDVIIEKQKDIISVTGGKMSILFIDIDNFKKVNDIYGHLAGDKVLKEVAEIILSNIRKSDYAFRYGGEEFLVILPYTSKEEAYKIAEKIRKEIYETPIIYDNYQIHITVSIGVSEFDLKKSIKENLEIADKKLYHAKKTGKNRIII